MTPDKSILNINRNSLDVECEKLPSQMFEWGSNYAQAKAETKRVKNRLELIYAQIGREVRANPQEFGLEKITESGIEGVVLMEPTYQKAQEDLIQAEYEEDILKSFVMDALKDKKSELENMITLLQGMYWSRPNTTKSEEKMRVNTMRDAASRANRGEK